LNLAAGQFLAIAGTVLPALVQIGLAAFAFYFSAGKF
jgi:hypothetical protein